ncbi:cytochrome b/b6 domain-containing protein [Tunturibacter empetritectus]|uniref:Thiosulfate reductase cytochrome b subunit n=1 Tax=Tunturiibacter lichenicola TaxID=2051959 RepID=A0A7W8N5G6_9BACT|nr:cytochrome b/b6 domain-containing protein [Edaphobacter lichenicola]MBB5343985.1 thiosulfate reductase cytochrome b subunit [Edaphobacter lichenicola]
MPRTTVLRESEDPRHTALVRLTHWITTAAFFALLLTGIEIVISHPRFYWGETGNVNMTPLVNLHIPSSRGTVPTGYRVLPDQNGWSRYLHFEAAWVLVLTGLIYLGASLWNGHLRNDLFPPRGHRTWRAYRDVIAMYLHRRPPSEVSGAHGYNVMQRTAYLTVIFVLFPLIIWTGLAQSPSLVSAYPFLATALGGRQSARTLHFLISGALLLFVLTHIAMVIHAGFRSHVRAMITGRRSDTPAPTQAAPQPVASLPEQP